MKKQRLIKIGFDKDEPFKDRVRFRPCIKKSIVHACKMSNPFLVKTLEGEMKGRAGAYLMMGVNGELYPCDQTIFKKTYLFLKSVRKP